MSCKIEEMSWREILRNQSLCLDINDTFINSFTGKGVDKQEELVDTIQKYFSDRSKDSREKLIKYFEDNPDIIDKVKFFMMVYAFTRSILQDGYGNYPIIALKRQNAISNIERYYLCELHEKIGRLLIDAYQNGERKYIVIDKDAEVYRKKIESIHLLPLDYIILQNVKESKEYGNAQRKRKAIFLSDKELDIYRMIKQAPDRVLLSLDMDEETKRAIEYVAAGNLTSKKDILQEEEAYRLKMENKDEFAKEVAKILEANIDYLQMDDILILSIKMNLEQIDNPEIDEKTREEIAQTLEKLFTVGSKLMIKGIVDNKENIQEFRDLKEEYQKRICNGKYITVDNIGNVIDDLKNGKIKLNDVNKQILSEIGEIPNNIFLLNKDNLIFALKNGYLEEENIYDLIVENKGCSTEVLLYMLKNKFLAENELIDLYMNKCVKIEQIREIEEEIDQLITLQNLMEKYIDEYEIQHEPGYFSQDDYESFETMARKVRALEESGFDEEKVEEAIYSMNSQNLEIALLQFYKNYFIGAETVYEGCGKSCIKLLRPADVRRMYENEKIKISDIEESIIGMNEEMAMHFICQVFSGEEYKNEFNRLINQLGKSLENEEKEADSNSGVHRGPVIDHTKKRKIDITTISNKYAFYQALDEESSFEYSAKSGYSIYTLPNIKFPGTEEYCIIIEPMVDKSHKTNEVVAAQDKSMWIIPASLWEKEKASIKSGKRGIDVRRLRELYSEGEDGKKKIIKVHHTVGSLEQVKAKEEMIEDGKIPTTGWPFRLLGFARGSNEYTEKELEEIMRLGISLEKSMQRTERE